MKIWFDMDGTISNLYEVENWLEKLRSEDASPYEEAKPLVRLGNLARQINSLINKGYEVGIISWCSKEATPEYDTAVKIAKVKWLKAHLPSVSWSDIRIVPYGTNKWLACGCEGILFDDEAANREHWGNGLAFEPSAIVRVLSTLNKGI